MYLSTSKSKQAYDSGTECQCVVNMALQCVAVYCSVLQCVAVGCSGLQCVAVCCSVLQCVAELCIHRKENMSAFQTDTKERDREGG